MHMSIYDKEAILWESHFYTIERKRKRKRHTYINKFLKRNESKKWGINEFVSFHACPTPSDFKVQWNSEFLNLVSCSLSWQPTDLVGLVVKASASRAEDPGFESRLRRDFFRVDSKIGTPVATLPGAWCYRVSAGTGWPSVSILWLGEMESLVCNFYLSVAARIIVWADPPLRYTCMLLEL